MLSFLLNNERVCLDEFPTDQTVLEFLRLERRRTGTKEGCASGDCGACTVVIAELDDQQGLKYQSINSCITFLGSLHGKQLITVEDLAQGDQLHPVQQAMVDFHGSQCGFCTPGFVMSLFSLYKNTEKADRHQVETALAGNLCRCTGYRPITEAAMDACAQPAPDQFSASKSDVINQLTEIRNAARPDRGFHLPLTLVEVDECLQQNPQARVFCGATDLALEVTQSLKSLPTLVYLGSVAEMQGIRESQTCLEIGAAVSYSDLADRLIMEYPDCEELLARLGSMPIRNQGGLGGNIANASPIGDMPPFLIAVSAVFFLYGNGKHREVQAEDFFTGYRQTLLNPGEVIVAVKIPLREDNSRVFIYKNSKRIDDDISTCLGVFNIRVEDGGVKSACIAFGGMAATPKRATQCEQALQEASIGNDCPQQALVALQEDFQPIDDVRASSVYRQRVAGGMLRRLFVQLSNEFGINKQPVATRLEEWTQHA